MDNNILKLAIDLGRGSVSNYSNTDADQALRKALLETIGTDKIDYKVMRRDGAKVFEILEVAIDSLVTEGLTNQFDDFVEVRNLAWGDSNVFTVDDPELFEVATISDGNGSIRRQRIDNGVFTVTTKTKAIKVYEELVRYLSGRINWPNLVQKVADSYGAQIKKDIYDALFASYDNLGTDYAVTGSFSETALNTMVAHVEASSGKEALILGTKAALALCTSAAPSDNMKDTKNNLGFYGTLNGTRMLKIPQAHKAGTNTFALDDASLIVVPTLNDKMIKLIFEGDSLIRENMTANADMSIEYEFVKRAGVAVVPASRYGIMKISG
jgi:hypothetical protein